MTNAMQMTGPQGTYLNPVKTTYDNPLPEW